MVGPAVVLSQPGDCWVRKSVGVGFDDLATPRALRI